MDLNTLLKIGETRVNEYIVNAENTAAFLGNKDINVLSTPSMISFMEITAKDLVIDKLPENFRVVGTKVNINHINPTPMNAKVIVEATLMDIEGSKLHFIVEAFNETCRIGFGDYEQQVIQLGDLKY